MNIPSKLKVGGLTYNVEIVDAIEDEGCAAFIDTQILKIKIEKARYESMNHHFLHEMLHAMNSALDEPTVEYLAMSLYQIIVDNPLLFKGGVQKHG